MDTDRSYRRPLFDLVFDGDYDGEPPPIVQQPGAPLETLLAFYAPSRTPRFVLGRVNYRPPTDQLSARLAVASALMARGVHPRQSLPR
jgi:hypothetical protein